MGFGVGIFLVALGAILAFAVHASVSGLDLAVVGHRRAARAIRTGHRPRRSRRVDDRDRARAPRGGS